jgi:chromosome segregation ATPase
MTERRFPSRIGRTRLAIFCSALFLIACASGPRKRVDGKVLEKLTIENRLLLFDAENELNIAVDARYQVLDEIEQIKIDIDRAKEKLQVAERDEDLFRDKKNAEKAEIAALRAETQKTRIRYLDARLDWARKRLDVENEKLDVARAEFELAKARLVKKNNVPGASKLKVEDFEKQVQKFEDRVESADAAVEKALEKLSQREEAWVIASQALQEATGGALGSRFLDD